MAEPRPAVVGGFALGGLGLVVAAILFFGGTQLFTRTDRAVVFFERSVGGLAVGAAVTFRGVRIGSVASVAVMLDTGDLQTRIPVYLEFVPQSITLTGEAPTAPAAVTIDRLIAAGLRAKLVSQSLITGQMLIDLDISPSYPAHYVGGGEAGVPEIPAIPSDIEELRQQLTQAPIAQTITQAQHTLAALERAANEVETGIGPLLGEADRTLATIARTVDAAGPAIQQVQQDASATLNEGRELAREGREQLGARGTELSRALRAAEQALRSATALFNSANSIVAPRSAARDDLEAMLRDLAASASTLRDVTRALERDPGMVLRGRAAR
jgi:paraquat-inducible protein B